MHINAYYQQLETKQFFCDFIYLKTYTRIFFIPLLTKLIPPNVTQWAFKATRFGVHLNMANFESLKTILSFCNPYTRHCFRLNAQPETYTGLVILDSFNGFTYQVNLVFYDLALRLGSLSPSILNSQ